MRKAGAVARRREGKGCNMDQVSGLRFRIRSGYGACLLLPALAGCGEAAPYEEGELGRVAQRGVLAFSVTSLDDAQRDPDARACRCQSLLPNKRCTLRAAVQTANACPGPDTIVLTVSGTYVLKLKSAQTDDDDAFGDLDVFEELTILSQAEPEPVSATIDASKLADRVFDVHPSASSVKIQGLKVQGGFLDPNFQGLGNSAGGCIRVRDTTLTLATLIVGDPDHGCRGHHGGGVFAQNARLSIYSSKFSSNQALNWNNGLFSLDGSGGGLAAFDGEVYVEGSYFLDDHATGLGGGIYAGGRTDDASSARFVGDHVEGNTADSGGGGLALYQPYQLDDCEIVNNSTPDTTSAGGGGILIGDVFDADSYIQSTLIAENAAGRGGGISLLGALNMTGSDVVNNRAFGGIVTPQGGGIYAGEGTELQVAESSVHGNRAAEGAGFSLFGNAWITNSTIAENEASNRGGGVYAAEESVTRLLHATVRANHANGSTGGGIHANADADVVLDRSILYDNAQVSGPPECAGPVRSAGMVLTDPASCVSAHATDVAGTSQGWGSLAYNPPQPSTATIALLKGNAGLSVASPCGVTQDQRGVARLDEDCDIGAYENPDL